MKTITHVNQHNIKFNAKNADKKRVLTIKNYKANTYADEVDILDKFGNVVAKVVYRPDHPLSCGAKVWIETYEDVTIK